MRKKHLFIGITALVMIIAFITNPTKESYIPFSEEQIGVPIPPKVEIERINFYVFSTYTPVVAREYGVTHLGAFGHFFKVSEGQFDYPWWLELFN